MLAPYLHHIALGSLVTLQMMPGQPWSGVERAGANKAAFNQRVGTVAMHFARGQATGSIASGRGYC